MGTRLELHAILCNLPGVKEHAYFQPPEGFKMIYPCVRYEWATENVQHADNLIYTRKRRYTLIVIDRSPDSDVAKQVGERFQIKMDRHYIADNLHHFVYNLNW